MAKRKTPKKKEEVNIMGKKYKVDEAVSLTLKNMAEALHAHEVALLTWVHKEYTGEKLSAEELESFRKSLVDYCMQIPEAENILVRMTELDIQYENEKKEKEKEENNTNGEEKVTKKQNKKEKDTGAKE